jgi:outer membrane protein TolC
LVSETTLAQPLTQLLKIHQAKEIAVNDKKMEEANFLKTENDVVLAVHQYYYGLLVAQKRKDAAETAVAAAKTALSESEEGVRSGNVLEVAVIGSRASLLQKEQSLIAAEMDVSDLNSELDDLLGLPTDIQLELSEVVIPDAPLRQRDEYFKEALSINPELRAAREGVEKSRHGISAAYDAYIPDITLFAKHIYQDGAPFLTHNVGVFGATLTWDIFDWGKRKAVIGERKAQLTQADENMKMIESRINVDVDKALRKLQKTRQMMEVSREALALRKENERLSSNQLKAGTITEAKYLEVASAVKEAEADEMAASLNHQLALRELDRAVGTLAQ